VTWEGGIYIYSDSYPLQLVEMSGRFQTPPTCIYGGRQGSHVKILNTRVYFFARRGPLWAYLMSYVKENRDDKKSAGPILKYNHKNNLGKALNLMKLVAKILTKSITIKIT
jgi:hypothetical protein